MFVKITAAIKKRNVFPGRWGFAPVVLLVGVGLTFLLLKVSADSPVLNTWNFSNTAEYIAGDASAVEIVSGTAQLKVLEYSTDANTVGLFHMNDSSGSAPADSSTYGLESSGDATSWNSTGKLNGSIIFNGQNSQVIVSDTGAISLMQANTLEAWIRPDSAFHADDGTGGTHRRMGIIDKGTYKLYLDSDTGKLTYELADATKDSWTQVGGQKSDNTVPKGSWDLNGMSSVSTIVTSGNIVYVGLGTPSGAGPGDAEVWRLDTTTTTWTKIGGDGTGVSPSTYGWQDGYYEDVSAMIMAAGKLYVGLGTTGGDAEVWSYDGNQWTKIGGDGTGATPSSDGWGPTYAEQVWGLAYLDGVLYASLGNGGGDSEVWSYDGIWWTKIGGDNLGWSTAYEVAYSMVTDGTNLFVGLGSSQGDAELYKYNGSTWTKIGGDGTGWSSDYETVTALYVDSGQILVGLGHSTGDADLYRYLYSSSSWTQLGGDGTGWPAATYENVLSIAVSGSDIYVGLGAGNTDGDVYKYTGSSSTWEKIGGSSVNKSWSTATYYQQVRSLAMLGGDLYAGVYQAPSTVSGTGELWKYDGSNWTIMGGEYTYNSWGYSSLNSIESLVQNGDKLFVGTGSTSSSANNTTNAFVFEYDGSSYSLIGGQGINSGWGSPVYGAKTYEAVLSMVSYKGELYAGLSSAAGDGDVWKWDGSSWSQVGGDGTGYPGATYEAVLGMVEYNDLLYAGFGNSRGDGDVYSYDGSTWVQVGGDGIGYPTNTYEQVLSMSVYNGKLYIGLGISAGDAEVWSYDGTNWAKVAGDGVGWSSLYDGVYALGVFKGDLYAGLGLTAGEAEVYKYDGTDWTKVGGDGDGETTNSPTGWAESGNYERVKSMAVYNGELYVSLGYSAGDGEVWRYNGSVWNKVGGDSVKDGWPNNIEDVNSMCVYNGKLYGGTGRTANADAGLWAFGSNAILQSTQNTWNADWYHVAATYDGSSLKMYVNGDLVNSASHADLTMSNTDSDLLIGTTYGERKVSGEQGFFDGQIDEVRISNTARTSFNSHPYTSDPQTVAASAPAWGYGVGGIGSFVSLSGNTNGLGTVSYRLSTDRGTTWQWWDGDSWETSDSLSEINSESEINNHISGLSITDYGILWQAVLDGNGNEQVKLSGVTITALDDTENPTPPTSVVTTFAVSGSEISPESFPDTDPLVSTWYNSAPTFTLSGAGDTGGAGIAGYWVYLGSNSSETPSMNGTFYPSTASSVVVTASNLNSGSSYYLRVQTKDKAQRLSTVYAPLVYRFDNIPPNNPSVIEVWPGGLSTAPDFTFEWQTDSVTDCTTGECAGVAGYRFRTGATTGIYSAWSETDAGYTYNKPGVGNMTGLYIESAPYKDGNNYFYLKSVDNAGNANSANVTAIFQYAGSAPTAPQRLTVDPESSNTNSFIFSWSQPGSFSGDPTRITYCYTINVKPSAETCPEASWTTAMALPADAYADRPTLNTFYVVARDEAKQQNYSAFAEVDFYANTAAPGIPRTVEIADVSVKTTNSWKLAISWEPPASYSGDLSYQVWHSEDGSDYEYEATTTGIAFVSTGLTQVTHYYKIKACDSTNNCGASTTAVSMLPTGRFTEAPGLIDEPVVSNITTKKSTITWATDRTCDTKIQYGTDSEDYFNEEPSNSTQTTAHEIALDNLDPGTKYYFVAKWTDEDGNTGLSEEAFFTTAPAPTVTDPIVKTVGIASVILQYTVQDASKIRIYYGKTTVFGGTVELSTSTDETTYNTTLEDLEDGTKYFYKINTFDTEDDEYEGNILSFETLPRPKIAGVKVQQVVGTAQPTVLISWDTNTEVSSIVTYYPEGDTAAARDEVNVSLIRGEHRMLIRGLIPQTPYTLLVKGRDKAGNEAVSDAQRFNTASDTRPPVISNLKVEGAIVSTADGAQSAQLVVSWDTDEGASSQVEFGEGTGSTYSQKSQEDSSLTFNHVVVISGLTPSKVYHLKAVARDKAGNSGGSVDTVVITPKSTDSAMNLVITNLQQVFGFLGGLTK